MLCNDGGPPWYAWDANGEIQYGEVPERLLRHPGLKELGIVPHYAYKPGVVFATMPSEGPEYVVKILDLNTEELPIYERLLGDIDNPRNHTIPCKIVRTGHPVLVMPCLSFLHPNILVKSRHRPLSWLIRAFHELTEGVEYLHSLHIAHLDLCKGNVILASQGRAALHEEIIDRRLYIIDFDTSRQFELGPGRQPAITLPQTQVPPPDGLTTFDPYSWDIYCLGDLLQRFTEVIFQRYYDKQGPPPRIVRWFIAWLIGSERGCSGVCHCRPSARAARRILDVLRLIAPIIDMFTGRR
ncbi:hypothetical protein OH77DRAFT_1450552 [Trametes cingulata]|nr:hypothetical protein OH77DRAFT_1450552 [Trametes cingulata]